MLYQFSLYRALLVTLLLIFLTPFVGCDNGSDTELEGDVEQSLEAVEELDVVKWWVCFYFF